MKELSNLELLRTVVEPRDLHKFGDKELLQVAREVRQAILQLVSRTGGHFSSNLGTVELTVAMYAAYEIPPDKVVWDTGHQAYPHKLLTGRMDRFSTLRQKGGLSGFLKRDEHPLDCFGAGHAGTAISAAVGLALARDQLGTRERVVAVTGDAAIGSGMCWEALSHVGELETSMAVVLNDNRMSIAPNVGALSKHFARLRSRPMVQDLAQRAKRMVRMVPGPAPKLAAGLRHGLTHYFSPDDKGSIFEQLGFEYIGPVDGHDLVALLEVFRNVRDLPGRVMVHALTVKGKGYQNAEEDARTWHGVSPFDLDKSELPNKSGPVTYMAAFGEAMCELAEEDPKVVAITAAMPDGTGLTGFSRKYPGKFYDVGIAESHAVTLAAGMAAGGLKPFCAIYSTFLQRGFDQVLHDAAIQKLPVRFCLDRAGLVGDDGPTHHGTFDLSYLGLIPHMTVLAPRDVVEMRQMLRWMASFELGPSAIRYPRGSVSYPLPEMRTEVEWGKAEWLGVPGFRLGEEPRPEVLMLAIGSMVSVAWEAACRLADEGLRAGVMNARFCKPLDRDAILEHARRAGAVVTLEENALVGGFGQQVATLLSAEGVHVPLAHIALADSFVEHGAQPLIREEAGLGVQHAMNTAKRISSRSARQYA